MRNRTPALLASLVCLALIAYACGSGGPASPSGTANLKGTVLSDATRAAAASGSGAVSVSVVGTGLSTTTDSAGRFTLAGVPSGSVTLQFQAPAIHAQLQLSGLMPGQTMTITVHVDGAHATLEPDASPSPSPSPSPTEEPPATQKCFAPGAHAEVEGLIQAMDAASITVFQKGGVKGAYVCQVSDTTRIRKGHTTFTLAQLQLGWRVHVSGTGLASSGTSCQVQADEIKVQ
jgi:hypothetical protein